MTEKAAALLYESDLQRAKLHFLRGLQVHRLRTNPVQLRPTDIKSIA